MLSDREDNVTLKFWVLSNGNVFWDYQAGEVTKAWFSYVGKITDDRRFYFLPTISDFADISDIHQRSVPDFPIMNLAGNRKCAKNRNLNTNVTAFQQFRRLVMSEIHRRRPRRYKLEFSFIGNDRRPSQKSGTRRENRNAPDSPDLSPFIPDDRGYLRFRVFISRQNLGRSGNSKIPDRLGFFRHMKTKLKGYSTLAEFLSRSWRFFVGVII